MYCHSLPVKYPTKISQKISFVSYPRHTPFNASIYCWFLLNSNSYCQHTLSCTSPLLYHIYIAGLCWFDILNCCCLYSTIVPISPLYIYIYVYVYVIYIYIYILNKPRYPHWFLCNYIIYIYCKGPPTWSIKCLHFKGAETCLNTWRTMWFFPMMLLFLLRDREEQFESPCRSLFGFSLRRLVHHTAHWACLMQQVMIPNGEAMVQMTLLQLVGVGRLLRQPTGSTSTIARWEADAEAPAQSRYEADKERGRPRVWGATFGNHF